jgi:septum formation protein
MADLVLASSSPRRRLLLESAGIEVEVDGADVDESVLAKEQPVAYAQRLARAKAFTVAVRHPGRVVLGADTIVTIGGAILGKPTDADDAERMLLHLAGRRHEVVTAVGLVRDDQIREITETTGVWMRPPDQSFIRAYVATGDPLDKAGAYGIQGIGSLLIDRIEGDLFNVMGLPLEQVMNLLSERA